MITVTILNSPAMLVGGMVSSSSWNIVSTVIGTKKVPDDDDGNENSQCYSRPSPPPGKRNQTAIVVQNMPI